MTIGGAEPRFPTGPRDQKLVGEKRIEPFAIDRDEMQALLASDKHLLIPSRFVIYSGVSARFEPATMRVFTQWSHPGADEEDLEGTDFELARTMISLHEPTHLIDTCNSSLGFRIFMTGPWGAFHVLRLLGILSELAEHDSPPSLAEVRSNVSVVEWLEGHQLAQLDSRMLDGFRVEEDQPAVIWPGMEEAWHKLDDQNSGYLGARTVLEANAIFRQTWALSREARSVLRAGIARTLELDPSRGWHYAVALEVLSFLQSAGMSVSQIALILDLCMWRSAEDFRPSRVKADHPGCRLRRILALIEAGTVSSSSKDVVGELCQTLGWCRPREVAQAVKTQAETFIAPLMGEPANALSGYRRYLEELHSFLDRRINEGPGFFSVPSEWKATLESAVKDKLIVSQYGGEIRLGRYMSPESKEELRMQDGSLEIPYMPPGAEDWYEYWFLGEILRQVLTEGDVSCPLEASRSCVARGDAVCTRDSIIADEMECAFGSVCAWLRLSRFG